MSSITNVPYAVKSMNSIIVLSDGGGTEIENGVVTCNELDVPRINVDQIESRSVGANVSLFTELVGGSVHLANSATTLFVDAPTTVTTVNITNLNATNISTNNIVSAVITNPVNLFTNKTAGVINLGTQMNTISDINIGKQGLINFSNSTLNIAGGANVSNLFCDNFRHEVYGTNVSLLLEEFGTGASIQMGNVSNRLIIYAPTTIVDSLKTQTIISPNPTILSHLFANNTSGNVSIATGLTTGILTLGSAGVVNIKGSSVNISTLNTSTFNVSTIKTNTITATNTSSNAVIYNNITTGTVQLANNAVLVEIGTNASTISLGYNSRVDVGRLTIVGSEIRPIDSASVFTIGGANMSTTQIVAVGTSQENVYLGAVTATAKVFVGDFKFTNDTMNLMVGSIPNVSGTMAIGNALTTGSLQLATGLTTGNVSIGNGAMTGNINIRTTGSLLLANSASSIELGTGASVTNNINLGNVSTTFNINSSTINLSSRFLNMGAIAVTTNIGTQASTANNITLGNVSTNLNFNASTISIGTTVNSNAITIGNISTVQFGIKAPINPDYDTKYTAGVAEGGTPGGCIGNYKFVSSGTGGALTSGLPKSVGIFTDLPIGVWLLYFTMDISCPTVASVITTVAMLMGTTVSGTDILLDNVECANFTLAVGRNKSYSRFQIYSNLLATTDVHLTVLATFTGTLTLNSYTIKEIKALRLA